MKEVKWMIMIALLAGSLVFADEPTLVTHWDFQAVHADGSSSFDDAGPFQVVLEGIVINNPEEWLDPTPGPNTSMGGEWQLVIQGERDDHAGTVCWMGQNYSIRTGDPDGDYSNEEWIDELFGLNNDPNTGYTFRQGDRVRVTGTYMFYGGKLNINERHQVNEAYDFEIDLLKPAVGLPQPEEVSLSELKYPDDTFRFDPNRLTGPEYYQARLVRINDVTVVDTGAWMPGGIIAVEDASGLTFPVKLGIGRGISKYDCPTGQIDIIGIMNQEGAGWPPDCTGGYQVLVSNYDGNGLVLGDTRNNRGNLPGDLNKDYIINLEDFAELAENWLQNRAGLYDCIQ